MKTNFYYFLACLMLFVTFTQPLAANEPVIHDPNDKKKEETTDPAVEARLLEIESRIDEIRAMDRSDMTKAERKAMKKELKELKAQSRAMGGGVYLSVGAIIIIILLLILIL